VEYQFSDLSLLANESFQKQMNKDPEGYGKDFEELFNIDLASNNGIISFNDYCFADSSNCCDCFHQKDQVTSYQHSSSYTSYPSFVKTGEYFGRNKQGIILILFKFSLSNDAMVCRF
jgi:hypothetical protein